MSSTSRSKDKVTESLSKLTLDTTEGNCAAPNTNTTPTPTPIPKPKRKSKSKKEVVDSWQDDDESSASDEDLRPPAVTSPPAPSAPPSTPFSATHGPVPGWGNATPDGPTPSRASDTAKRPEKTDAVARRLIAAGLGLKAPKQTEEQKAYQKSVREQEKKKREQEKEEEQRRRAESEMAKAAVWED
ncbi:hypothetical protein E4U41_006210 [Claviceps citrina]|nr:hypothetical protein E4U41_006210 [Claviceps citrina]